MSSSDPLNEFSHLPTVDEEEADVRDAAALWEQNRKSKTPSPGASQAPPPDSAARGGRGSEPVARDADQSAAHEVEQSPRPQAEPEPGPIASTSATTPAADSAAWQELLNSEPQAAASSHHARPPMPPAPRKRLIIRSNQRHGEPAAQGAPDPAADGWSAPAPSPPAAQNKAGFTKPAAAGGTGTAPEQREEIQSGDAIAEFAAPQSNKKRCKENADRPTPAKTETAKTGDANEKEAEPEQGGRDDRGKASDPEPKVKIEETPREASGIWWQRWEKMGGRALGISLIVHAVLLLGAGVWAVNQAMQTQVDFLPGGSTAQGQQASEALQHKIQQKKNPWLKQSPVHKIAAANSISEVVLPEEMPDLLKLPSASDSLLTGKFGGSMGLAGAGGGFGKGMGLGARDGMVFQPLSMFGMEIKARRLALILDVSASMAPHLPRVIDEVDRVAKGSVVVLYVGCGLAAPPPRERLQGDQVFRTSGPEFERFWRAGGESYEVSRKLRFNSKDPIPSEDLYRMLSKRPQTYFIHAVGVEYAWLALLCNEVRSADALYWFSDFQDSIEFKQCDIVRENLINRKQRLYVHAYQRGGFLDTVLRQLVEPTNGDSIIEE